MSLVLIGSLLGGIGLFLLGMRLMTDGLKYAAGSSLRTILANSTKTPLLGIFSGAFLTSLVQSSSAVIVGTLGFVNAGLMNLNHAISLVYGSNLGTTVTGWLVSLIGFKFKISAFALPVIGAGMLLRILRQEGRYAAIGDVFAGFGIFFMGIGVLKSSFSHFSQSMQFSAFAGEGILAIIFFVGIGFILTFLMQSSSAAIAIILTATAGNVISLHDAAAVVIGANIGTTSTAALAVIGATPNAKRLAGAHVIFNLVTGFVALLLLPFLIDILLLLQSKFWVTSSHATILALFHTTFNVIGILLLYPATKYLVSFLQGRFRTTEEDEAKPQYLDSNVIFTPILALHALEKELIRLGAIATRMATSAISMEAGPSSKMFSDKSIVKNLVNEIATFGSKLQRANLPKELDNQLPNAIRVSGYYNDIALLSIDAAKLQAKLQKYDPHPETSSELIHFKKLTVKMLGMTQFDLKDFSTETNLVELENLKDEYREIKARMLKSATIGILPVNQMVKCTDVLARFRRICEQAEKAARYLAGLHLTEEELEKQSKLSDSTATSPEIV